MIIDLREANEGQTGKYDINVMNICRNAVLCQIDGMGKCVLWLKLYLLEI